MEKAILNIENGQPVVKKKELTVVANELVPVYENKEGHKLVNARELHEWLGSGQEFTNWIKGRIEQYKFAENIDFTTLDNFIKRENSNLGTKRIEYIITLNMAKELSMVEKTEKGKQARQYFIKCEEKLKDIAVDPYKGLSPELKSILMLDRKTVEIDNRVTKLESNMTIDYAQQEELSRLAREKIVRVLGGKGTPAYKKLNKKVFSEFWRDYKRIMRVNSYKNTPVKNMDKAILIIDSWKPSEETCYMILGANSQMGF